MKKFLLLPLVLISNQACADDRVWTSYPNMVEIVKFDEFFAMPAADRAELMLHPTITPQNKTILASNVVMTVVHGKERQRYQVGSNARLPMPYRPLWHTGKATILINQPTGEKMDVGFGFDAVMPAGTKWQYASLMDSVTQANSATKRLLGLKGWFVKSWKSVNLVFARPAQVQVVLRDGVRTLATNARTHTVNIKFDAHLMKDNPVLTLSERPLYAVVDTR